MKFCNNCGNGLREDAVFCPKCGQQVGSGVQPVEQTPVQPAPQPINNQMPTYQAPVQNNAPKSGNNLPIIIAIVIGVLIVGLVLFLIFKPKNSGGSSYEKYKQEQAETTERLNKNYSAKILELKGGKWLVEVQNNNNEPVYVSDAKIELYDANRQSLKTIKVYTGMISANSKGYGVVYNDDFDKVNYVSKELTLKLEPAYSKDYTSKIKGEVIGKDKYANTVRLTNISSEEVYVENVGLVYYDANNTIVGYERGITLTTLKAGQNTTIEIDLPTDKNYKAVSYSRYDLIMFASEPDDY